MAKKKRKAAVTYRSPRVNIDFGRVHTVKRIIKERKENLRADKIVAAKAEQKRKNRMVTFRDGLRDSKKRMISASGKVIPKSEENKQRRDKRKIARVTQAHVDISKEDLAVSKKALTRERINVLKKTAGQIGKKLSAKAAQVGAKTALNRQVLRKGPRPTLDLRRQLEREEPVKQHGFKAEEIGNNNFLFN